MWLAQGHVGIGSKATALPNCMNLQSCAEKPDLEEIEAYDDVLSKPDFAQLAACARPGQPEPAAYFDLGDNSSLCIPLDIPRLVSGSVRVLAPGSLPAAAMAAATAPGGFHVPL